MPCKVTGVDFVCLPWLAEASPCNIMSYRKLERAELQVWEDPGGESSFRNCSFLTQQLAPVNMGLMLLSFMWVKTLEAPGRVHGKASGEGKPLGGRVQMPVLQLTNTSLTLFLLAM